MNMEVVPQQEQPTGLALFEGGPQQVVDQATKMAEVLQKVINDQELFSTIQGKKYVQVEGWTTLGAMLGVFPFIEWSRLVVDSGGAAMGWEARCVVKRPDGAVIGAAEDQCMRGETKWAKSDDYALRSMAQTRATSKAMRLPLAWVMTLAGYAATPYEEMPDDQKRPARRPRTPAPAPANGDDPGKARYDLKVVLEATFSGDEQGMYEFVNKEYPDGTDGATQILRERIPAQECERMIGLLKAGA